MDGQKHCRFCRKELTHIFCDLGHQPPSNSLLTRDQLEEPETYYPLKVYVCGSCWLVQIPEIKKASEIFNDDYPYYSSQSPSNVSHAKEYVEMMCERFGYNKDSKILEIGSNDGYLLQFFRNKGIMRCMGYEPAEGPRKEAVQKGVITIPSFFNSRNAESFDPADLICSINTIAHQPDINDFVEGMKIALAPGGIITAEFPHLMRLVEGNQFDTIYHEHYNYFSLGTICTIFRKHGLDIFDVDELPEHGGSLRIYAKHSSANLVESDKLIDLILEEINMDMHTLGYYNGFQEATNKIKRDLMSLLINLQSSNEWIMVTAYGAPAKGNTLLNYCGIKQNLIPFTVDRSPHKQNKYLPGSHIPIYNTDELEKWHPEYVLILPWNIKEEIMKQLKGIREWGGKFIVAIPNVEVL